MQNDSDRVASPKSINSCKILHLSGQITWNQKHSTEAQSEMYDQAAIVNCLCGGGKM